METPTDIFIDLVENGEKEQHCKTDFYPRRKLLWQTLIENNNSFMHGGINKIPPWFMQTPIKYPLRRIFTAADDCDAVAVHHSLSTIVCANVYPGCITKTF